MILIWLFCFLMQLKEVFNFFEMSLFFFILYSFLLFIALDSDFLAQVKMYRLEHYLFASDSGFVWSEIWFVLICLL